MPYLDILLLVQANIYNTASDKLDFVELFNRNGISDYS